MSLRPQARLSDKSFAPIDIHGKSCCPHIAVSGPALEGSPDVFVNGLSALRVGDKGVHFICCGENKWEAIEGSASILINGKPACRLGDKTKHCGGDGTLIGGSSDTLLGDVGGTTTASSSQSLEEKKKNLEDRKKLIEQGKQKAAQETYPGKRKDLENAVNRLELNNRAVERARLAEDVYNDKGAPIGWKRLNDNPDDLPDSLKNATWEDPKTGLRAALYESEIDGSKVLVFRGTSNKAGVYDDIEQAIGYKEEAEQYIQAINLAKLTQVAYGTGFETAGHSLGGGLASAATAYTGTNGYAFNPAGVHPNTLKDSGRNRAAVDKLVDTFYVEGEALTMAQNPLTNIVAVPVGGLIKSVKNVSNLFTGKKLSLSPAWVYDAVGKRHKLPALDQLGNPVSASPKSKHGMGFVINGMEKQKREDKKRIEKALEGQPK